MVAIPHIHSRIFASWNCLHPCEQKTPLPVPCDRRYEIVAYDSYGSETPFIAYSRTAGFSGRGIQKLKAHFLLWKPKGRKRIIAPYILRRIT